MIEVGAAFRSNIYIPSKKYTTTIINYMTHKTFKTRNPQGIPILYDIHCENTPISYYLKTMS